VIQIFGPPHLTDCIILKGWQVLDFKAVYVDPNLDLHEDVQGMFALNASMWI
jgi:hypothetical protein